MPLSEVKKGARDHRDEHFIAGDEGGYLEHDRPIRESFEVSSIQGLF